MMARSSGGHLHAVFARAGLLAALGVACQLAAAPAARAQTVNIADYFVLGPGSQWSFTGAGQPDSTTDNDFTWTVLPQLKGVGLGTSATQILTTADGPVNQRPNAIDYWRLDLLSGSLYYHGFYNGTAQGGLGVQDIIFDHPILVGTRGMHLGDTLTSTTSASFVYSLAPYGSAQLSASVTSTIHYVEIVPRVDTVAGTFFNCLRVSIQFQADGTFTVSGLNLQFPVHYSFINADFLFKRGVGLVKVEQTASPAYSKNLVLKQGMVLGNSIVADYRNAARDWAMYR